MSKESGYLGYQPASPTNINDATEGLLKREEFAIRILERSIGRGGVTSVSYAEQVALAVLIADALVLELERTET